MKNSQLKCLLLVLSLVFTNFMSAQGVTGTVSDSKGPLPGVSVLVKGTSNGTQTDFEGKYKINNASGGVLVFSFIGYKTKEISVAGKSVVNVTLDDDAQNLKEVMVIGYGTVKKKDATGAVDQLSSKKFDNVAATSAAELLRGKVAGVQITSSSGEPGASLAIRVRGNSSLRSGNNPLIVVDGVPLDGGDASSGTGGANSGNNNYGGDSNARGGLNFINQNDIESMTVLKDASSTAIYGSRGANGVIIITTKKGKSKEGELTLSTSSQISTYSSDFDVLSSNDFASRVQRLDQDNYNSAYTAEIVKPGSTVASAEAAGNAARTNADFGKRDYDWKKAILQTGLSTNYDLAYSIGSENSNTRISLGMNNTDGIVKKTGIDKYTVSFNNSTSFFDSVLKLDTKILYAGIKDRATLTTRNAGFTGNLIGSALYWNPTRSTRDDNGDYTFVSNDYFNPEHLSNAYTDYTNTSKIVGSVNANLKLTSKLKFNFLFGVEGSTSIRKYQIDPTFRFQDQARATNPDNGQIRYGQADIRAIERFNKTFENTLTYANDFSENFGMDALVGYSYYDFNFAGSNTTAEGFDPSQTNLVDNIDGAVVNSFRAVSRRNRNELQSYFGRVNFTLFKNLLLTGSIRRDGSSRLGENDKYGNFPAAGLAYKLVNDKEGFVNNIKIRGNYGVTGNQEFPTNSAIAKSSFTNNGAFGDQVNANPDLRWETTTSYGAGIDFSIVKNRVTGSVDYFLRDTKDLIFPKSIESTQPSANSLKYINLDGTLENTGIEASLNIKLVNTENLSWDFGINGSFLKNKIKNFGSFTVPTGELNGQGLSGANAQIIADGLPVYTYFMFDFKGYDANGNSIYTDANGNNALLGDASRVILDKQPLPKVNLGFNTAVNYKNFDASVSFYGAFGHYIYNNTSNAYFFKGAYPRRNVTPDVADSVQSASDPNSPSTKFLEKGDFLRMGNLTLGYTFKGEGLQTLKIKTARFFVNGQNLLLFTDYSGFDPEVDTDKTLNGVPSAGIDYLSYPRAKSISLGVNLTF
jgi:TonB-dependent starch-binding outer membrane protein SusC